MQPQPHIFVAFLLTGPMILACCWIKEPDLDEFVPAGILFTLATIIWLGGLFI